MVNIEPSVRSTAYGKVNQLRDPALYTKNGTAHRLYASVRQSSIAISKVIF